jgi:hypothetical protein
MMLQADAEKDRDQGRDADAPAKGSSCEVGSSFAPGTMVLMADWTRQVPRPRQNQDQTDVLIPASP